jgi:uncharacterized protein
MSTGLIALLDDVVALAKLAALSLDDAATQAVSSSSTAVTKAAGIVIDDAAVTPRYVVGLAAQRELPIISKIAVGSLKNKILILLPGALLLSFVAAWAITPLLMIGGAFLCFEGWHKVSDLIGLHKNEQNKNSIKEATLNQVEIEKQRVVGAIRTDFILSAEIMAITLATVSSESIWLQGLVLFVSGLFMTLIVYGAVAIIVKADDFGFYLASKSNKSLRFLGRGIVSGMPIFLGLLTKIGMLAMLWVGGGIIVHGLGVLGAHSLENWINQIGLTIASFAGSFGAWFSKALIAAIIGLFIGAIADQLVNKLSYLFARR